MNQAQFVAELGKLRPSSTFLSIKGYRNQYGEVANYNIAFHINYKNALERSLLQLGSYVPVDDLEDQAREKILNSLKKSLDNSSEKSEDKRDSAYLHFSDDKGNLIKGVKLHIDTNTLHLYGFVVHKKVIMPGNYPKTNQKPLTKVSNSLRSKLPVGKFRQFKITPDQVESISVENLSLLPPE